MTKRLEQAVDEAQKLSEAEQDAIAQIVLDECWDREIAADFTAGKFNKRIAAAQAEFERGEAREI